MVANVSQFVGAGLDTLWWSRLGSDNLPKGVTGTLANGSDVGMTHLLAAKSLSLQPGEPRIETATGDDGPQAIFFFKPAELPNGDLVLGVANLVFDAAAQNLGVIADGDYDVVIKGAQDVTYKDLCIVRNSQGKSRESGSLASGFEVEIFGRIQAIPRGQANIQEATPTEYSHVLIANIFDTLPWGTPLTVGTHYTTGGTSYGPFFAENRITMHTFVSDGSTLTFTVDKTPAAASGAKFQIWKTSGGTTTKLTYTTDYSVNVNKTITLVAAGTAGDVFVCRYEYVN